MTELSAKNAFYAGSFDPLTNGHLSVIEKAVKSFDRLVVAIGNNPNKKDLFPMDVRLDLIKRSIDTSPIASELQTKIQIISYTDYSVSAAIAYGCGSLVRGVRNIKDFEEENLLSTLNDSICDDLKLPRLQTHLFIADADKVGISSSMVKMMIGFPGWEIALRRYVPHIVLERLIQSQYEN